MRVLLTRAREDAEPLAAKLRKLGIDSDIEPMLSFAPLGDAPLDLDRVQALIFTSANGVRMLAKRSEERALPVFAVGDATAAAARALGFRRVESAAGAVDDLARLIADRLDPVAGPLFHGAARDLAGDLKGQLETAGFALRREILYEAIATDSLGDGTARTLADGRYDAVAFFSPRTARTFARLVQDTTEGSEDAARDLIEGRCHAACLSQAVASEVAALSWASIRIADRPTQTSLVDLLAALKLDLAAERPQVTGDDGSSMDEKMAQDQDNPASPESDGDKQDHPALAVIAAFGGIRPMATKLDIPVSTVQGWRERGVIPSSRHAQILEAALEHDVEIDAEVVAASAGRGDGEDHGAEGAGPESPDVEAPQAAQGEPEGDGIVERSPWRAAAESEEKDPAKDQDQSEEDATAKESKAEESNEQADEPLPEALADVAAAAAARAQVPPEPPRRRGGVLMGLLLAVVLFGGGAVAAVATKAQWAPLLGATEDEYGPAVAALEQQVADLGAKLDGLSSGLAALEASAQDAPAIDPAEIAALESGLAGLAGEVRELGSALDEVSVAQVAPATIAAEAPDLSSVTDRLATLEETVSGLAAGATQVASDEAAGSAGAGSTGGGGDAADLGPVLARLAALEANIGQLDAVSALSSEAESRAVRLAALEAQAGAAQTRVAELERATAEAAEAAAAAANAPPPLDGAASARHVALMLAVVRLKDAIESALPFGDQLASVEELFADDEAAAGSLAALAGAADGAMPTVEELRKGFPKVAREIVAQAAGGESKSWTAGVKRSLASIVTVRRTGKIEGNDADAIVARAEIEIGEGNLAAAVEELTALPGEKAQAAAADWRRMAERRVAADRAVEHLAEIAVTRIAGAGG